MDTPVKLQFDAGFRDVPDAVRGFDMKRLAESVFPSCTLRIPAKDQRCLIKAPVVSNWDKASTDIYAHLLVNGVVK